MELINFLQNPAIYDPVPDEVRMLETHMSWVLLAAPYAYKIKKPVDLGFADFTSLDKRRYYCEEELRLNQPLAPQLYLAVVPITGSPDAAVIGGSGEPIEFAVKMLQFPQSSLFRQLLREGQLLARHIDDLARAIAHFHRDAPRATWRDRFGTAEAVRESVEANFRETAKLVTGDEQLASLRAMEQWSREEFAARRLDFTQRKRNGMVRECHGDMHLANIVLLNETPVLFDRIEFNEDFRWINVMNELAFPVMDLVHRGPRELARRLLNAYVEETGDYAGLTVLPYYVTYRAVVRAKVSRYRGTTGVPGPLEGD